MPVNNNDTYAIDQSNGMLDSDQNLNGFALTQTGATQIVWDDQSIDSGGNSQSNNSNIVDSGLLTFGLVNSNDDYTVGQQNNMFDSDKNTNAFVGTQTGFANIAFVDQHVDSGGNTQSNNSDIGDGAFTGLLTGFSSNDTYDVTQFNGMRDDDTNGNSVTLHQSSLGPLFTDLAFVSQDTSSGGNSQSNDSGIGDGGATFLFSGFNNNDSFTVDQSNEMLDNDTNLNITNITQLGALNLGFVNQDITSGGNSQENNSGIGDLGVGGLFAFGSDNDTFDVGQSNQMSDNDANANKFDLGQGIFVNLAGANQSIDSGGNEQSNNSSIYDFGASFGFGSGSNNDHYTLEQGNLMIDNDINVNVGIVTQLGFGNVASLDQDITSGGNTQTNNSNIFDGGLSLGFGNNNDTYDLSQTNQLVDSDSNQNLGSVTQIVGAGNFADLTQGIDAGGNDSGNNSNVFDLGL